MLFEMFILKIEYLVENLRSMPFKIRNFKKERKLLFLEINYLRKPLIIHSQIPLYANKTSKLEF